MHVHVPYIIPVIYLCVLVYTCIPYIILVIYLCVLVYMYDVHMYNHVSVCLVQYDNVLMEESAQILEVETFIPLMLQVSICNCTTDICHFYAILIHSHMCIRIKPVHVVVAELHELSNY